MSTPTAAIRSVAPLAPRGDVTVSVTFCPSDPIGLTDIVVDPDPGDSCRLLQIVEAAVVRAGAWRDGYMNAEAEDAAPPLLPVPWYGWDR